LILPSSDAGVLSPPAFCTLIPRDATLLSDGKSRVIGYTLSVGQGAVTYIALGHCHNPAIRAARAPDPADTTPPVFHGAWERDAFLRLLRNAIAYTPAA